jgi:uncharacterized protein YdbL (DUF1318 family)
MKMKTHRIVWVMLAVIAIAPAAAWAAKPDDAGKAEKKEPKEDPKLKELQERFKQRYEQIRALKKQGAVGETYEGYLDYVTDKKPDDAKKLVDAENADRKELYESIAKNEGTTTEKVAERNAKRNFSKATAGEFLKGADGKWTKKS